MLLKSFSIYPTIVLSPELTMNAAEVNLKAFLKSLAVCCSVMHDLHLATITCMSLMHCVLKRRKNDHVLLCFLFYVFRISFVLWDTVTGGSETMGSRRLFKQINPLDPKFIAATGEDFFKKGWIMNKPSKWLAPITFLFSFEHIEKPKTILLEWPLVNKSFRSLTLTLYCRIFLTFLWVFLVSYHFAYLWEFMSVNSIFL